MSFEYPHPVSRTYQYKKITKPLLERKRRARINRCLEELKNLMMEAFESEGENISKLEKADILELTVRHLQRLQEAGSPSLSSNARNNADGTSEKRWQLGFGHCATEACRYLASLPGESGEKLAQHLASGLQASHKINIQITPKAGMIPSIPHINTDTNSNHIVSNNTISPLQTSESSKISSPINSEQYSKIFNEVVNNSPINLRAQENILIPKNIIPLKSPSVNYCSDTLLENSSEMIVETDDKIEDDEEIDVEGIDDEDPMWRPW
ncbi:hypothetical protein PV325_002689 [Microctonus aethiopoides]|nr:hypothetical protein PV325_002689 [Microctonus aethiopoides]KAK0091184.1 hypothetical protein PV326_003618 [Microctonus aethiopoides]